ncbi:TetR/AcrR family transcriptional regulator [Sphingopyxis yananensis]|uniref:TetR/AcrR family transcriptional regulator n=1 Tax=Sphingopyxis yananensis TaxID=2886687 RepID=UPI001D1124F9|nr:TetR/AcrR family transcriptional regulator [Sphingopyxis yananensis]MCC2603134.1 TetR/AcrR family transcriptional regulator [Sphingopyxis yananensis]
MTKKRITGAERRTIILAAARQVFASQGYEGAKTLDIAKAAQVSEALVYRHFPSKLALYRAVLRQAFREQDENWTQLRHAHSGAKGIVHSLFAYFSGILADPDGPAQIGYRLNMASLASDGYLASLVYRRSQRLYAKVLQKNYDEARADGDLIGEPMSVRNLTMFNEHIGSMMNAILRLPFRSTPYDGDRKALARDATIFCARGLGIRDEVFQRYLAEEELAQVTAAEIKA